MSDFDFDLTDTEAAFFAEGDAWERDLLYPPTPSASSDVALVMADGSPDRL